MARGGPSAPTLVQQGYLPLAGGTLTGPVKTAGPTYDASSPAFAGGMLGGATATQNTSALIAAIQAVPASGGGVYIPPVVYSFTAGSAGLVSALNDRQNLVIFSISPATMFPYLTAPTTGCVLKATAGSGIMLQWKAVSANTGLMGNGMDGIAFDCNSLATDGLDLVSHQGFRCPTLGIYKANGGVGLNLRTVDLASVEDFQEAWFGQLAISQTTGTGMQWSSWQDGGGNVSINRFDSIIIYVANSGTCLLAGDSDHNTVGMMELNTSTPASVDGLDLLGAVTGPFSGHARGNYFEMIDGPARIVARSTGYTVPSGPNYVKIQTGGNAQPFPTIELGARLSVVDIT